MESIRFLYLKHLLVNEVKQMNNNYYLDEMHNYIEQSYKEFEKYQGYVNDIFKAFHAVCVNNNISYVMAYGSLIGVVRDKGNIPWDYDIDVIVPVIQRNKLMKILAKELKEDYYYTYYDNVETYPTSCLRVCKKGFPFTTIHLDVFFLIGCPKDKCKRKQFMSNINKLSRLRSMKFSNIWFRRNDANNKIGKILNIVDKVRAFVIPKFMYKREVDLMYRYKLEQTGYCCVVGAGNTGEMYNKSFDYKWFSDRIGVKVNGQDVFIPIGYDNILSAIYGDYKKYPPIETRFKEFYGMINVIRERNKEYMQK